MKEFIILYTNLFARQPTEESFNKAKPSQTNSRRLLLRLVECLEMLLYAISVTG